MSTRTLLQAPTQLSITAEPRKQRQLLLHEPRKPYQVEQDRDIPQVFPGEVLVQVQAIGLNPIDWKSAQYGFALPSLPSVNGREFVGRVVDRNDVKRLDIGDTILSIGTDYRDFRKSAFQEFAIASDFNTIKITAATNAAHAASIGVAFVASALGLGICLGLTFPTALASKPLDLLDVSRSQAREVFPEDVVDEVFGGIDAWNRPHAGEWILIYGASSVTAQIAVQLAQRAGLRIAAVADLSKHRTRLEALGAEKLFDRTDLDKAREDILNDIRSPIRFALDAAGPETATWCQDLLAVRAGSRCSSRDSPDGFKNEVQPVSSPLSHLVCLTGTPKERHPNVRVHEVPIKLFHENKAIGRCVSAWLQKLLETDGLKLPETVFENGGLNAVEKSLERLRSGEISGRRLVVRCDVTC